MRNLFIILLTLMLAACLAGKTTINSMQGEPIDAVIKRLGQPNQQIQLANGHIYYVYNRAGYQTYRAPSPAVAAVTSTRKGPLLVQPLSVDNQALQPPAVLCTMIFEVNAQHIIMNTKTKGSCYGSQALLAQ